MTMKKPRAYEPIAVAAIKAIGKTCLPEHVFDLADLDAWADVHGWIDRSRHESDMAEQEKEHRAAWRDVAEANSRLQQENAELQARVRELEEATKWNNPQA